MNRIVVFIHDVLLKKDFELLVSKQSNFYTLIHTYRKDYKINTDDSILIIERFTHMLCDKDVSFDSLGVESGMHFIVF